MDELKQEPGSELVSVVMSVYNEAGHLQRAVESILGQTHTALELMAINDGSTDGSADLLDRMALQDSRLRVIHQPNSGLTRALIRGCAEARGDFIARQDADDWSHPARLAEQLDWLRRDARVGFVSCAAAHVGPRGEHLTVVRRAIDPRRATEELLEHRQGPPAHGSVMFRKSAYLRAGGYRPEFLYSQDSDLWLRMAEHTLVAFLPEVRYETRRDLGSISAARRSEQSEFARFAHACRHARRTGSDEEEVLARAREFTKRLRERPRKPGSQRSSTSTDIAYLIGSQLVQNGDHRARGYLREVIQKRPWHWKAWLRLLQSFVQRSSMQPVGRGPDRE